MNDRSGNMKNRYSRDKIQKLIKFKHACTISLFRTSLSFCLILAWDFSCAMSAKFKQC